MQRIRDILIENGTPGHDGRTLAVNGAMIRNVMGCVPVHLEFNRRRHVGKAYIRNMGRELIANFELADELAGLELYPCIGCIIHKQAGSVVTSFTIVEIGLCVGGNRNQDIKPFRVC